MHSFYVCFSSFLDGSQQLRSKRFAMKVANVVRKMDEDPRTIFNDKGKLIKKINYLN